MPFEYSGVSLGAFLIAALAWIPLNYFYPRNKEIDRAIAEDSDPFECLLKRAQDKSIAISITMTNGKVYIGFVTHQFNPAISTKHIGIFPIQSGYREQMEKRMHLTTNYSQAYEKMTAELDVLAQQIKDAENRRAAILQSNSEDKAEEINREINKRQEEWRKMETTINQFEMAIPINQISSVNLYNREVHNKYFAVVNEPKIITV